MVQAEATMTGDGQVTIPEAIRREMRAKAGDTLVFEADEQGVQVRVRHRASFRKYAGALREGQGKSIAEIVDDIRDMRGE